MIDIKGYEGLYAVTSCARVWSYRRKIFLKPTKSSSGYYTVKLSANGVQKTYNLHRLVAEAYLPNPDNLPQVSHLDEDRTHNWVGNLEWADVKTNNNMPLHKERCRTTAKPVYCFELDQTFESATAAAHIVGVYPSRISECCRGITKTSAGYHWEYVKEL